MKNVHILAEFRTSGFVQFSPMDSCTLVISTSSGITCFIKNLFKLLAPGYVADIYLDKVCLVHSHNIVMLSQFEPFVEWYIIDQGYRGEKYAKYKQVARCGNAVPPPFAEALVRANLSELCVPKREVA